jgi:hypothetical protein
LQNAVILNAVAQPTGVLTPLLHQDILNVLPQGRLPLASLNLDQPIGVKQETVLLQVASHSAQQQSQDDPEYTQHDEKGVQINEHSCGEEQNTESGEPKADGSRNARCFVLEFCDERSQRIRGVLEPPMMRR